MRKLAFTLFTVASLVLCRPGVVSGGEAGGLEIELKNLVEKVQAKIQAGKNTESDLAENLKEFEALVERHKDEKTDAVAQVLYMEAMLYNQVLNDPAKGVELVERIRKEYPSTKLGQGADKILAAFAAQEESKKIQRSLAEGTKFPDFDETDTAGEALFLAGY